MKTGSTKIYLPDGNGGLSTFLPVTELAAKVGVRVGTVNMWIRTGAVRHTPRLRGRRNASLEDAVRLRLMTPQESQALGISRLPADVRAVNRLQRAQKQRHTEPAFFHGEPWSDDDVAELILTVKYGDDLEEFAIEAGRTYAAVADKISELRRTRDLPSVPHDMKWLDSALAELLPDEVARLKPLRGRK